MITLIFVYFSQAINIYDHSNQLQLPTQSSIPPLIPISAPVEYMKANLFYSANYEDILCSDDNINNPECSVKCRSIKSKKQKNQASIPTQTPIPDSSTDYIDKLFNSTMPNGQVLIQNGSNIKQISGCHFININLETCNTLIRLETEVQFFNNIFEYTDLTNTYLIPIYVHYDGNVSIRNCKFINARCTKVIFGGNVLHADSKTQIIIDSCEFINCGTEEEYQVIIVQENSQSSLELIDCSFIFHNASKSCSVLKTYSSNVVFNRCIFDKCGRSSVYIQLFNNLISNHVFRFTDNIVQNSINQFFTIDKLISKPEISGNIFKNITVSENFISIIHNTDEILLYNNTFSRFIASNSENTSGGAIAPLFQHEINDKFTIIYEKCNFHSLINAFSNSPYDHGGAIQHGYDLRMYNTTLIMQDCEFIGNKCENGKGGALALKIYSNLEISNCTFEDNHAEGEGGAIYISCTISDSNTIILSELSVIITITSCRFISNKGSSGQAIYIEQENIDNTKLNILECTFINNDEDKTNYMIFSYNSEINFENNIVEYLEGGKEAGAIYFNNPTIVSITNSSFINCITETAALGFPENIPGISIFITNSEFLNCLCSNGGSTIYIPNCFADFDNITISFDSSTNSNGGINFGNKCFSLRNSKIIRAKHADGAITFIQSSSYTDPITISGCTFDDCGNSERLCFLISTQSTTPFTFENNVIQNMNSRGNSNYLASINFNNKVNSFTIDNLTLINNSCNSDYGGGSGLQIYNVDKIIFEQCNFIQNVALSSIESRKEKPSNKEYFSGDGGGIQYGFVETLLNIELFFNQCIFRENKAVRHGGAIAIQMNQNVEIEKCTFENNIGNHKLTNSKLLYENYFDWKSEGRGGAIYINPAFTYENTNGKTPSIRIEGCTFQSNRAYDGCAIYIEGENAGTTFIINDNDFIDNYDPNSLDKSVIISEIMNLYNDQVVSSNRFTYSNPEISITPLTYVDHYAQPLPTPSIILTEIFSYSNKFSKSEIFSHSNDFSSSEIFSHSNVFSKSSIFTGSKIFTSVLKIPSAKITHILSKSITMVVRKSVSMSISFVISNIASQSYTEDLGYVEFTTQSYVSQYFPYIIHYLSPSFVETYISITITKKSKISPEQLIGVVCGSVSVFFLILGIIILIIRKKRFNDDNDSDYYYDLSDSDDKVTNKQIYDNTEQNHTNNFHTIDETSSNLLNQDLSSTYV